MLPGGETAGELLCEDLVSSLERLFLLEGWDCESFSFSLSLSLSSIGVETLDFAPPVLPLSGSILDYGSLIKAA